MTTPRERLRYDSRLTSSTFPCKVYSMIAASEPWLRSPRRRWRPPEMTRPPLLDPAIPAGLAQPRYALLINPFYPKDPNASFGKHVLTPTFALTSFAATTPEL